MERLGAALICLFFGTAALFAVMGHSHRPLGPHEDSVMTTATLTAVFGYAAAVIFFASWCGWRKRQAIDQLNPGLDAELLRLGVKAGVYGLNPGATYRVVREIKDCYGTVFPVGMELIFVRRHFLPYHGGHTVVFQPRPMYLQEQENADVLDGLDAYLEEVPTGGSAPLT